MDVEALPFVCLNASPSSNFLVSHSCTLQKSHLSYRIISFPLLHFTAVSATHGAEVHTLVRWLLCDSFANTAQRIFFFFFLVLLNRGKLWEGTENLSDLPWIFTARLAELKQILATLLYGQWDKLAQFSVPLHLDMRVLFDSAKTKGISGSITGMREVFS